MVLIASSGLLIAANRQRPIGIVHTLARNRHLARRQPRIQQ